MAGGGLTHIELEETSRLVLDDPSVEIEIMPGEIVDPDSAEAKIEAGNIEDLSPAEFRFMLWKVGRMFGDRDGDDPYTRVLGEYVDRFEEETYVGEALKSWKLHSSEE